MMSLSVKVITFNVSNVTSLQSTTPTIKFAETQSAQVIFNELNSKELGSKTSSAYQQITMELEGTTNSSLDNVSSAKLV